MVIVFIRSTACDVAQESQASFRYHVGKRGTPDTVLTPRLLYDKCKGSSRSCGERMYQMHLSGNISTLLWPMFHIHTSEPELGLCLVQSYLGMLLDA